MNVAVAFMIDHAQSHRTKSLLATRVQPVWPYPSDAEPDERLDVFSWSDFGLPLPTVKKRLDLGEPTVEFVYAIVPSGFAFNTLFYTLLIWLIFFAPFAAQRALRRKRRLCEKCAYPVGASPICTECGAAVAPRAAP